MPVQICLSTEKICTLMMKAITELGDYGMALLTSYYAANVINHQLHLQQQTQAQAQAHQQQQQQLQQQHFHRTLHPTLVYQANQYIMNYHH